jgi:heptosyltransferase-1
MALAARVSGSIVPPQLTLEDAMALLGRAETVIGLDTGLTHLAAALGAATVGIFAATDPALTGIYGSRRAINIGGVSSPPTAREVVNAFEGLAL